jgi:predicted aspartyl protease
MQVRPVRVSLYVVVPTLALALAGCGSSSSSSASPKAVSTVTSQSPSKAPAAAASDTTAPTASGTAAVGPVNPTASPKPKQTQVKLRVLKKGGATIALADVRINGQAFVFVVDTGATSTLVDKTVATALKLVPTGKSVPISGVAGSGVAQTVRVTNWSVGDSKLPASNLVTLSGGGIGGTAGLLGSDVLSRFGKITIDYANQVASLG